MANIKYAILQALIDGAVCELLVKTGTDNVYLDDGTTTLSAKLAEMITALNAKATSADLTAGLSARPTTAEMNAAISAAVADLIGGAPGAYDTFKELADYIATHENVADALTAAVGNKADASLVATIKATVDALGSLATKSTVSESDLDADLKAKVNAASQGNHSHENKNVLDSITETHVSSWNGKGKFYASSTRPAGLTSNDLWAKII